MNSSFPNKWSFSYLKFTKYVTNIIAEPKYKYGQQEQVTVRNQNRSTALERSVLKYWGVGGGGRGLKPVLNLCIPYRFKVKICFGCTFMYYMQVLSVPLLCNKGIVNIQVLSSIPLAWTWRSCQYSGALQYSFSLNMKELSIFRCSPVFL